MSRLMIVIGTPPEAVEPILDAIAGAGGGVIGHYTHCSFSNPGLGRFKPDAGANPHLGEKEALNSVEEVRIETFCDRAVAKAVLAAIRAAHPYEEPVIYMIPVLDEDDL